MQLTDGGNSTREVHGQVTDGRIFCNQLQQTNITEPPKTYNEHSQIAQKLQRTLTLNTFSFEQSDPSTV